MYNIIQKRKIWLSFSSLMVVLSIAAISIWGLNLGIDFTGGALLEVKFSEDRPAVTEVQAVVENLELGSSVVQPVEEKGMIIRYQETSEEKHQELVEALVVMVAPSDEEVSEETGVKVEGDTIVVDENTKELNLGEIANKKAEVRVEELRFESVGPVIGEELKSKSLYAMFIVLVAIVLYIAWAFRKVSKPVASWKYGLSALVALFHDVIITVGVFSVLGEFYNIEINTPFVAALLTVLGYSVNDTIVVFDRVRENLPRSNDEFEKTVNTSVNQTIQRSINTSVTTLVVLLSIVFFGGDTIRDFVTALSIGVLIGTYSSIFLASPLLVVWEKFGEK